jgi:DNA-binding FrmR family transcriptional regulator
MPKQRPSTERLHASHPEIVKRLKRASGHLKKTIEMIESRRSCLELAQQLAAVEHAIASAKRTLVHDHIEHCLDSTIAAKGTGLKSEIEEFKAITKFL